MPVFYKALVHFAAALAGLKRHTDIAARFAGDEFVVLLPSTGSDNGETFITRLTDFLDTTPATNDQSDFFVKFSFGIASALEKEVTSPSDLLKLADNRLYRNKKNKS
ncbi:MAG: GGDEF domain-containing protein [Thermodesulfobacteriota bacterium]|nr:GGDEF domain-containing protein [Thermodesulfobacteriota bacterium]